MADPFHQVGGIGQRRRANHQPCPVRRLWRALQIVIERRPGKADKAVHFQCLGPGPNGLFKNGGHFRGSGLIGAFGHVHLDDDTRAVCVGEKLLGHERGHAQADHHQQGAGGNQPARVPIHQATEVAGQADKPVFVNIFPGLQKTRRQQGHGRNCQQIAHRKGEHDHHRHAPGEIRGAAPGHQQRRKGGKCCAGRRTQRPGQLTDRLAQGIQPAHALIQMALYVFNNHNGVVDQDTQGNDHPDNGNLMQHPTPEVIEPHADQGHHGQDGRHQQAHADTHAGKYHRHNDQYRQHQAPGQIIQPVRHLVGLKKHLAELVRLEVWTHLVQPFPDPLAKADGVGGTFFHDN